MLRYFFPFFSAFFFFGTIALAPPMEDYEISLNDKALVEILMATGGCCPSEFEAKIVNHMAIKANTSQK